MTHHLFLSPHHPASAVLQQKLEERLPGIACSTEDVEACAMMLVVLDAGASGDAEASSPALNNDDYRGDILHALSSGVGIVSLLVGATRLEAYASQSKRGVPLWKAGLYDTIAIPTPDSLLRPGDTPVLAREDPELEATALGRVGLRIQANSARARESGRLRSGLLRALTALGGIAAGCMQTAKRLLRRPEAAVPVTTAGFQVGGIKQMATNPMFDSNSMHGKDLPSATKARLKIIYDAAEASKRAGVHHASVDSNPRSNFPTAVASEMQQQSIMATAPSPLIREKPARAKVAGAVRDVSPVADEEDGGEGSDSVVI